MTTHATTVTIDGKDIEVELELSIAPAERYVGIMSAYIDDWSVTSVDGDTSKEAIDQIHKLIETEVGEDAFMEKIHDEGAADDDFDDYWEHDR